MALVSSEAGKIHSSVLKETTGSWALGPLTIAYDVRLDRLSAILTLYLLGHKVGIFDVEAEHPTITLDFNVAFAEVEGSLAADFAKKQLEGEFEVRLLEEKKQWCGPIVHW